MIPHDQVIRTFPSATLPSQSGGLAVEVSLIAQLGVGSGDHLFESVVARQKSHHQFIDALEEPSAKLGGTDFAKGDPTSLYSFSVGAGGHPFHRHAGHRIFTAISGSGGAQLRFSSASPAQLATDPHDFVRALRFVNIPPDCLFTVRFGGDTWHQFAPLLPQASHPAFFALSCHTNELGGPLSTVQREQVLADNASIPSLTDLLPANVQALLASEPIDPTQIPTTALSLDAPAATLQGALCKTMRSHAGRVRGSWSRWRGSRGFVSFQDGRPAVVEQSAPSAGSLLRGQLQDEGVHHEDCFALVIRDAQLRGTRASDLLAALLEGFIEHPPAGVSRMMALRNVLVKPLGLRTSSLGCPVSSLLSAGPETFAGRFPVLGQAACADGLRSQVVLGADDKHLRFRSCVGVQILPNDQVEFTLGTRVHYKNLFGRLYMGLIDRVHRGYISPAMLQLAVNHVTRKVPAGPAANAHREFVESNPVPASGDIPDRVSCTL